MSLRIDERLSLEVRRHAAAAGMSVNRWISSVLRAAVDPDLAGSDAERTRARLARAGLLESPGALRSSRHDPEQSERARREAGRGTSLSVLVSEGRD